MKARIAFAVGALLASGTFCAAAVPSIRTVPNIETPAQETVLYSFAGGLDGATPLGSLIEDSAGAFYGTTAFGGSSGCAFGAGCGTVFKLAPSNGGYVESILYRFQGGADGNGPGTGLVEDSNGALYGTTEYGGSSQSYGTVFKLTPKGSTYQETLLHVFTGGRDGIAPLASLILGPNGVLYGNTLLGGTGSCGSGMGCGTVFSVRPSGKGYTERVIYRFKGKDDGATPAAALIMDSSGTLYGAAGTGGVPHCGGAPINDGCGTVFTLTPNGSHYAFRVLHHFHGAPHDGGNPFGITRMGGTIFGTTEYGGKDNVGSVFMLTPGSSAGPSSPLNLRYFAAVLHSFHGRTDGEYPLAGLALSNSGTLYGVTQYGGGQHDSGTAFQLVQSNGRYVFSLLHRFTGGMGGKDAGYPVATLLLDASGALYGTSPEGGRNPAWAGTVFRITP